MGAITRILYNTLLKYANDKLWSSGCIITSHSSNYLLADGKHWRDWSEMPLKIIGVHTKIFHVVNYRHAGANWSSANRTTNLHNY